jgi:hypothetical protein
MIFDPPLETHATSEEFPVTGIDYNHTYDDVSGSGDSQALRTPHQSHASTQVEAVIFFREETDTQICRERMRSFFCDYSFAYSYLRILFLLAINPLNITK